MPLLLLCLALTACAPATVERPSPTPTPLLPPTPTIENAGSPQQATPVIDRSPRIERVALATRIGSDGAPMDETTVVSEWPEMIYLCVLMSEIDDGTRLRAYWFQDLDIVAQSDMSPPASHGQPTWVALRYRPIARLDPTSEYAVELRLGDTLIDRFLFRVGAGNASDIIAELAFTSGFDADGKPLDARTRFMPDESPLTLRMRISNQVDPEGMVFTSLWYRGDAQIATVAGEMSRPSPGAGPDQRKIEYSYSPPGQMALGWYAVDVLLNGMRIETIVFEVSAEPIPPSPTPSPTPMPEFEPAATEEPSPTPQPSPTPVPSPTPSPTASATPAARGPDVRDVTFASSIDDATRAPLSGPVFSLDGPPGSVADLWVAIFVTDLTTSDNVEITVVRDGETYGHVALPRASRPSGWLAVDVHLDVPEIGAAFVYTVEVLLNGQRALSSSCQIRGV